MAGQWRILPTFRELPQMTAFFGKTPEKAHDAALPVEKHESDVSKGAIPGSINCSVETSCEIAPSATDSQSLTQVVHERNANRPKIKLVYFS